MVTQCQIWCPSELKIIVILKEQARNQVWIWGGGGAFQAKVDLLRAYSEKLGFFAPILGKSGLFRVFTTRRGHVP